MSSLHIALFGRFRCTVDEHELNGIDARKVQELLIYLLLHRTQPCTRESLATLLWGERNDAQAKKYLRQTLWQLQSAFDAASSHSASLLRVDAEWVEINRTVPIWLDVEEFEATYGKTHPVEVSALSKEQVDALCQAVALYQGDLLTGWYQDWCIFERERLQQMFLSMLDKLIAYAEYIQDSAMGIHYCELSLRCDPARERTYRRLMRLHCLAGNRTAALRQYETCVEMLRRELGVEPAKSTLSLYEQIRRDQVGPQNNGAASLAPTASDQAELNDVLQQLGHLETTLRQTLQEVQRNIACVEKLIHREAPSPHDSPLP